MNIRKTAIGGLASIVLGLSVACSDSQTDLKTVDPISIRQEYASINRYQDAIFQAELELVKQSELGKNPEVRLLMEKLGIENIDDIIEFEFEPYRNGLKGSVNQGKITVKYGDMRENVDVFEKGELPFSKVLYHELWHLMDSEYETDDVNEFIRINNEHNLGFGMILSNYIGETITLYSDIDDLENNLIEHSSGKFSYDNRLEKEAIEDFYETLANDNTEESLRSSYYKYRAYNQTGRILRESQAYIASGAHQDSLNTITGVFASSEDNAANLDKIPQAANDVSRFYYGLMQEGKVGIEADLEVHKTIMQIISGDEYQRDLFFDPVDEFSNLVNEKFGPADPSINYMDQVLASKFIANPESSETIMQTFYQNLEKNLSNIRNNSQIVFITPERNILSKYYVIDNTLFIEQEYNGSNLVLEPAVKR